MMPTMKDHALATLKERRQFPDQPDEREWRTKAACKMMQDYMRIPPMSWRPCPEIYLRKPHERTAHGS